MRNKLAIIIPAYNEETYLGGCLDAVFNQSKSSEKYDVIVINNASTDKTAQVAEDKGATVVNEQNKGYEKAVKRGFDEAIKRGYKWAAVTDADTRPNDKWVENIFRIMEGDDVVGATGPVWFYDTNIVFKYASRLIYKVVVGFAHLAGGFTHYTGQNMIVSLQDYQSIGGLNVEYKMSPDVDLSRRLNKEGEIVFDKSLYVEVSARRFKKQPLDALINYTRGLFSVLLDKPIDIKWDDVR